jgi:DNA (cytosine-5)-methyltransferase 1
VIILDGCCGAGGAARGYVNAGHLVHGIDISPRLRDDYLKSGAASFTQMDVLRALRHWAPLADFVHVSPPCQFYSQMSNCRSDLAASYPDLIGPVRELLNASGKPWIIENVEAAGSWMKDPVVLCGWMFGRETYRHRLFEAGGGFTLDAPPATPAGMAGRRKSCGWPHPVPAAKAGHWVPGKFVSVSGHERRGPVNAAMGIDWMRNREDVAEAIPPYFTEWIGRQLGQ